MVPDGTRRLQEGRQLQLPAADPPVSTGKRLERSTPHERRKLTHTYNAAVSDGCETNTIDWNQYIDSGDNTASRWWCGVSCKNLGYYYSLHHQTGSTGYCYCASGNYAVDEPDCA